MPTHGEIHTIAGVSQEVDAPHHRGRGTQGL